MASISHNVYWGEKWVCSDASLYLNLELNVTVFYQFQYPIGYRCFFPCYYRFEEAVVYTDERQKNCIFKSLAV